MAKMMQISYPDQLPDVMNMSQSEFEASARLLLAVKLFEMQRISAGMAAELAGMERVTFLLKLREFRVTMIDLEVDEFENDLRMGERTT
ncbi:MAG TPA: UPF0175 family protein [Candidatus Ozemobacteraceae bacterium]|nr:UPF0175 family protein [Candidatus Ozemobacteraceae bacterium]